jgi:hypothetical protein
MNKFVMLYEEYQLVRTALISAGIEMTDSIDALYRDWYRWREKYAGSFKEAQLDQWWADHLAQFLCLIDPQHVAARGERARKDKLLTPPMPSS